MNLSFHRGISAFFSKRDVDYSPVGTLVSPAAVESDRPGEDITTDLCSLYSMPSSRSRYLAPPRETSRASEVLYKAWVPRDGEWVRMRAKALYQTGLWIILPDCSSTFNSARRVESFKEVAYRFPAALTPFVVKFCGGPVAISWQLESGEC